MGRTLAKGRARGQGGGKRGAAARPAYVPTPSRTCATEALVEPILAFEFAILPEQSRKLGTSGQWEHVPGRAWCSREGRGTGVATHKY
jgi:hypothetical protein